VPLSAPNPSAILQTAFSFRSSKALIDDARRENVQGLLTPLNMLIEFSDAFDYPGADFRKWRSEVGFHFAGPSSAAVAYK